MCRHVRDVEFHLKQLPRSSSPRNNHTAYVVTSKEQSREILKREATLKHRPHYRAPGPFATNGARELKTRSPVTLSAALSCVVAVSSARTGL